MPTWIEDELLTDSVRAAIHDFALAGREILMTEAHNLLEGVYGLQRDGRREPPQNLPALADPEQAETYRQLIQFLNDEVRAGLGVQEAQEKLAREVAFTHLNRLVAFKMMEERRLIRETIRRGVQSNGFKFYLADHSEDQALFEHGQEDPAYRHFLLWQAGQISQEVAILFEPDNLASRLFPRPPCLALLLALLNQETLAPAWQAEETVGWIYQFFNEREKAQVFDWLFKDKKKIRREDIPAATQLFTPRWIVRYLTENTLGRLWVQMHPDSALKDRLKYLVPLAGTVPAEIVRPVKDISLLDPACGTMHFGLIAFDLLAEMYLEEITHAGAPGWPEQPSVSEAAEIPASILRHNLFGIDIDLRATQLSALTLYLRAKRMNKTAQINAHNLACADVLPFSTADLGRFILEMHFANPIFEKMLMRVRDQLEDINQLGSLLRIENEIHEVVEEERRKHQRYRRIQQLDQAVMVSLPGMEVEGSDEEYFELLEGQLIQALDFFRKSAAQKGDNLRFFVGEAAKSLRILDLLLHRYDCVVANPPYMSRRSMNETLADFLSDVYPTGKGDLYAAFIQRCFELANERGRVGMITQQSFMFISSYEKMRTDLLGQCAIETMAHTGPRAFAEITGEKVNTTAFVLRKEPDTQRREGSQGTYFRLVHEQDADAKRLAFEKAVHELQANK